MAYLSYKGIWRERHEARNPTLAGAVFICIVLQTRQLRLTGHRYNTRVCLPSVDSEGTQPPTPIAVSDLAYRSPPSWILAARIARTTRRVCMVVPSTAHTTVVDAFAPSGATMTLTCVPSRQRHYLVESPSLLQWPQ